MGHFYPQFRPKSLHALFLEFAFKIFLKYCRIMGYYIYAIYDSEYCKDFYLSKDL